MLNTNQSLSPDSSKAPAAGSNDSPASAGGTNQSAPVNNSRKLFGRTLPRGLSMKMIIGLVVLVVLVAGAIAGLFLTQMGQDIRQQAVGNSCSVGQRVCRADGFYYDCKQVAYGVNYWVKSTSSCASQPTPVNPDVETCSNTTKDTSSSIQGCGAGSCRSHELRVAVLKSTPAGSWDCSDECAVRQQCQFDNGAACVSNDQCKSKVCSGGRCTNPTPPPVPCWTIVNNKCVEGTAANRLACNGYPSGEECLVNITVTPNPTTQIDCWRINSTGECEKKRETASACNQGGFKSAAECTAARPIDCWKPNAQNTQCVSSKLTLSACQSSGGRTSKTACEGTLPGTGGQTPAVQCITQNNLCNNNCCDGLVCQGTSGNRICQKPEKHPNDICGAGGTCTNFSSFICPDGLHVSPTSSGKLVCERNHESHGTNRQAAINKVEAAGCGQWDQVCAGGTNAGKLCGDFEIVDRTCPTPTTPPQPTVAPTTAPITYACNSTCTTDAQCKNVDSKFVCADTSSGKRCRLASNLTHTQCQPAAGPMCLAITLNNVTNAGASTPVLGDQISLTCGQVSGVERYTFRIIEPDGTIVNLSGNQGTGSATTGYAATTSSVFTISKAGRHFAQCQICPNGACNSYEAYN